MQQRNTDEQKIRWTPESVEKLAHLAQVPDEKFSEEFEQQLAQFGRFVESTGEYVPYLIRKAERIEEYQQQR